MRILMFLTAVLLFLIGNASFANPPNIEKYPPYKLANTGKKHLLATWDVNIFDLHLVYDVCEIYRSLLTKAAASAKVDLHKPGTVSRLWADYKSGKYATNLLLCEAMKQAIPRRVMLADIGGKDAIEKFDDSLADDGWKFKPLRPKGHHLPENYQHQKGAFVPPTKKEYQAHMGDFNATLKKKVFDPHSERARKGN